MYIDFEMWLNRILQENLPIDAVAVNFNLYEEVDSNWSIQLVATERFDEEDEDWVCDEVFTTGEDLFSWQQDTGWEEILDISTEMVNAYLEKGKYADDLKKYAAVGIGFVDGDVSILYRK